ncbi:hypothetical protein LR021_01310 [Candidatus Bipolaricaulota bacterium]|nr:hypothetical protein [Candidatus Bipolaricaulota bacterium]
MINRDDKLRLTEIIAAQSLALHNICAGLGMAAQSLGIDIFNRNHHYRHSRLFALYFLLR